MALARDEAGSGVPVVLLHGLTYDRTMWAPVVEALGGRVRTIAFDLPGHGDSPGGSPGTLDDVADVIHAEVEALGLERPVLVGHSIAGAVAMTYAARRPVRGVVNVDQPLTVEPFAQLLHRLEPALRGDAFVETFHRVFQSSMGIDLVPEPLRGTVLERQRIEQDLVLGYWDEAMTTDPAALQGRIDAALAAVDVPVLAVFGRALPAEERDRWAATGHAELEVWDGRGHLLHLVEPERFAARLLEFAARPHESVSAGR